MAISSNSVLTYSDLVDSVKSLIQSKCSNIGDAYNNLPANFKNGGSFTIKTQTISKRNGGDGSGAVGSKPAEPITYKNVTLTATGTISDSLLVRVESSTVISQLEDFHNSRGILTRTNTEVSFKMLMNFYNNVSAFLSERLVLVGNSFASGTKYIFYNAGTVVYPTVTIDADGHDLPNSSMTTNINDLLAALAVTDKMHSVNILELYHQQI